MPRVRYLSSTDSRRASLNLLRRAPCRGAPKGDLRKALSSEIDLSSSVADSKGNPFGAWIRRGDHLKSLARLSRTAAVPRRRRNPFFHQPGSEGKVCHPTGFERENLATPRGTFFRAKHGSMTLRSRLYSRSRPLRVAVSTDSVADCS